MSFNSRKLLRTASVLALVTAAVPVFRGGQPAQAASTSTISRLTGVGSVSLSSLASGSGSTSLSHEVAAPQSLADDNALPKTHIAPSAGAAPTPPGQSVSGGNGAGFNGLNIFDQTTAGTGKYLYSQYDLEPPDQGLCVGNGYVVEAVNNAMTVYNTSGQRLISPVPTTQFFNRDPEIIWSSDYSSYSSGKDFLSDPKCYYDVGTQRWFLTELQIDVNPDFSFGNRTHQLIAVSQSSNPTGNWNIFQFDTTDDGANGTPSHAGCPCLGDQPLIGADANGFYVSTNEFPLFSDGFNGSQVYAISKSLLERASSGSTVPLVHFDNLTLPASSQYPGGPAFSIQPATSPGTRFEAANNGTEYLMSSTDESSYYDNRIAVWALTNTASLNSRTPSVGLTDTIVGTETYGMGGNELTVKQQSGPRPYGASLRGSSATPMLDGGDDRLNQVVYAAGSLWAGLNTTTVGTNGARHTGVAYFVITPSFGTGALAAGVTKQGYLAITGEDGLFYPSIGVNDAGRGVIAFSISGPDFFPSTGYATINATDGAGAIKLAGIGAAPEDGFTGYSGTSKGVSRWGDYGAAVAATDGSIWFANEYIPNAPRTYFANWGSYVGHVNP